MGSAITTWNDIAGPIYMGANTSWEVIWLAVSVVMCVVALIVGSRHEKSAYRKADNNKK